MPRAPRRIAGSVLAAFAAIGAVAAYLTMTAFATGRGLDGAFCTLPVPPATNATSHICMSLTWDGVTYGTPNPDASLALRPGTYWITVNDNSAGHNFTLRSCPDSTSACVAGTESSSFEDITTIGRSGRGDRQDEPRARRLQALLLHRRHRA